MVASEGSAVHRTGPLGVTKGYPRPELCVYYKYTHALQMPRPTAKDVCVCCACATCMLYIHTTYGCAASTNVVDTHVTTFRCVSCYLLRKRDGWSVHRTGPYVADVRSVSDVMRAFGYTTVLATLLTVIIFSIFASQPYCGTAPKVYSRVDKRTGNTYELIRFATLTRVEFNESRASLF